MSILERRTEVSVASLLDEIVGATFNADLNRSREHDYMSAIGELSDQEIEEYCTTLENYYPGVGARAVVVLKSLRDKHKGS